MRCPGQRPRVPGPGGHALEGPLKRRRFVRTAGLAGLGLGAGACGYRGFGTPDAGTRRINLAPVHVSWDRIIRTTVALRPYRPSGFVLKAERLDEKTVIHNYGHGGAGMSLSWGTAHLATQLALDHTERRAAVIGCGIIGLTTARLLQRRGFEVSIYARALPPDTTSNKLWGGFTPASTLVARRTAAWDSQFRYAVEFAYREHQLLAGRGYGVGWIDSYALADRPDGRGDIEEEAEDSLGNPLLPRDFDLGRTTFGPGEHPFARPYARRGPMLQFDPDIYLEALLRDVLAYGGKIHLRSFEGPRDLVSLPEPLMVNCTGMGAGKLFSDGELIPVKGQLTVLAPQPEVNYSVGGMIPRGSGIVLGHVRQPGVASLAVDRTEEARVVEAARRIFDRMRPPDPNRRQASYRRPANIPAAETFFGLES